MNKYLSDKKIIVVVSLLIFLGIVGLVIIVILISSNSKDTVQSNSASPSPIDEDYSYRSEYLSAELVVDWEIREYYDGEAIGLGVEGVTYKGLTGIEIYYKDEKTLELSYANGVGGTMTCDELIEFPDTSDSYVEEMSEAASFFGNNLPVVEVTEFEQGIFFGKSFRISGEVMSFDNDDTDGFFNMDCTTNSWSYPDLSYTVESSSGEQAYSSIYFVEILSETLSSDESQLLSNILSSLEYIGQDNDQVSEETNSKTYFYDEEYIIPGFSVGYPNWNESISQSSGAWDISLENNDSKLFIDLSGQGNSSFEQSLSDWVTNWGSKSVNYSYEVLENGMLAENRNFIIYKVSEDNKDPYILAIVDVAQMYEGRGHLAVKAEREEDINYVEEIIASVKTIN